MDADKLAQLKEAIEKTTNLFRNRTHANDWSRNIIEGSAGLKTKQQWGRFYKWMSNPTHFKLTDTVEYMDVDEYNPPAYEDGMEVEETMNGPDLFIRIRNTNTQQFQCDEKEEKSDDK